MATTLTDPLDDAKTDLIAQAARLARERGSGERGGSSLPEEHIEELLTAYYRHVAPEDVAERTPVDLLGALASHHRLAQRRLPGQTLVRVTSPSVADEGWTAGGRTVVEVVTDDMSFLVDTASMELARQDHDVHVVLHPQLAVERDDDGALLALWPVEEGAAGTTEQERSAGTVRESWMHLEIGRLAPDDTEAVAGLETGLHRVLADVRRAVEDWPQMREAVARLVDDLAERAETTAPGIDPTEVRQARELLAWLADDHFTFLGYKEYDLVEGADGTPAGALESIEGTGLGILRPDAEDGERPRSGRTVVQLPDAVRASARHKTLLVLAKANSRATVHRPAFLDYVGVKTFDAQGEVVGERRFLGLFSSAAYTESLTRIPLLRERASAVLERVGFAPSSHAGKALLDVLETYPRDELFQTPVEELARIAEAVMYTRERRQLRMFVRRDTYGRYLSVLVYLPRDRYNTAVREKFEDVLRSRIEGASLEFTARLNESAMARVHFVVHAPPGELIEDVDPADLERRFAEVSRSWRDDLHNALVSTSGESDGTHLARRYAHAFPEAYKEDFDARTAATDVGRLEAVRAGLDERGEGLDLTLHHRVDAPAGEAMLKVFRVGPPLSLSAVLPMISSMGVEVLDERPYELEGMGERTFVYDFALRHHDELTPAAREAFAETLRAIWDGLCETDRFNALVGRVGLRWRKVSVLRAYARYMRQGGSRFSTQTMAEALLGNVAITSLLVRLFETRFDPAMFADHEAGREDRAEAEAALTEKIRAALDEVVSLDHDRILRAYLTHLQATVRTSFFRGPRGGVERGELSLKLEPASLPDLPAPRPQHEIFVYSPRVEGVHLRFGAVARGGLRWSDRRDDFRTEILGLVKAQMVKNTVIVPVGAKGGFYAKQLPSIEGNNAADREAWLAEGVSCYRAFVSGLLEVTDNLVDGEVVPPRDVVRHDGDDTYLVVAADKGTATFSDIANEISNEYGFWLGDAFASGGSVGYDHKAMGITARGAWVSVRRHFREMGVDTQSEEFSVVGVGDMSGDVFGNGMLCSPHIRLVAAFDHRDIFLDPAPDAAASFEERTRLFGLARSSWKDYDRALISEGGGVHPRSAKSIAITPQVRERLGLGDDVTALTPNELMQAILTAPVDLVWNGGIGTYVKASTETHADAGDKSNDTIRVDGRDLRARCVAEGGNLGLTQLGRIEYARLGGPRPDDAPDGPGVGGRINTDFIDNSAGVDTSDREVNIKILLDGVVRDGDLTVKQRNDLLASMTDEVAALVLDDNYQQNLALANAAAGAPALLHVHDDWMRHLEREGVIDRRLEGLPARSEVRRRLEAGEGLSLPELSVLLSWTKIVLADTLLSSDLPDDPYFRSELYRYFPKPMQHRFRAQMDEHPLRRQIIVTQIVGELIDNAGMTFWHRLGAETGAAAPDLARAATVATEIYGARSVREQIASFDNRLDAAVQTRMRIEMRTLVERASRWLVLNRRTPTDAAAVADQFEVLLQKVLGELPELLTGREQAAYLERRDELVEAGVPDELAERVAVLPPAYALLSVVETASRDGAGDHADAQTVARTHFALGERLGLSSLLRRILGLPRDDRWQTMARAALRDDLHAVHAQLTAQVLRHSTPGDSVAARVSTWEDEDAAAVQQAAETLEEVCAESSDLARASVGMRVVRGLVRSGD